MGTAQKSSRSSNRLSSGSATVPLTVSDLVQPVNTVELFSDLKTELAKTLAQVRKIGQGSPTYNGHFLSNVTRRLRSLGAR